MITVAKAHIFLSFFELPKTGRGCVAPGKAVTAPTHPPLWQAFSTKPPQLISYSAHRHSPAPASLVLLGGVRMVDVGMYVVEVRYLGIWSERKSHSEALGGGRGSLAGF